MQTIGGHWGDEAKTAAADLTAKLEAVKAAGRACDGDMAVPLHASMLCHAALLAAVFGWDREFFLQMAEVEFDSAATLLSDPAQSERVVQNLGLSNLRERMVLARSAQN